MNRCGGRFESSGAVLRTAPKLGAKSCANVLPTLGVPRFPKDVRVMAVRDVKLLSTAGKGEPRARMLGQLGTSGTVGSTANVEGMVESVLAKVSRKTAVLPVQTVQQAEQ